MYSLVGGKLVEEDSFFKGIRPSFLYAASTNNYKTSIEVGVRGGENARRMMEYRPDMKLYLVDIVDETNGLDVIVKPSVEAAKDFKDKFFDYAYIDADHSTKSVLEDIIAWYPKVKIGGILGGHDAWKEEVMIAVGKYFSAIPSQVFFVGHKVYHLDNVVECTSAEFMDWWVVKQ